MSTNSAHLTDDAVRRAAIERLGCADASVSRYNERPWTGGSERELWCVLSIKRTADAEWEVIGRRRTRAELLALIDAAAALARNS